VAQFCDWYLSTILMESEYYKKGEY
jgi:hypothetical protein